MELTPPMLVKEGMHHHIPRDARIEVYRRVAELIEEAYRGRPSAPNYEGAVHWLGMRETLDGTMINPELRKHAASRMKEEADVQKERRRWTEECLANRAAGDGGVPPKGKGKGKDQAAPAAAS